jgi:hypothetical protein
VFTNSASQQPQRLKGAEPWRRWRQAAEVNIDGMRHRQELSGIQSAPQYQLRSSASCMSAATRHLQRLRRSYVSVSKSNNIFRLSKWQHQLQLSTSGFDNSDNDGMA